MPAAIGAAAEALTDSCLLAGGETQLADTVCLLTCAAELFFMSAGLSVGDGSSLLSAGKEEVGFAFADTKTKFCRRSAPPPMGVRSNLVQLLPASECPSARV